jgi:hypothetical protein
MAEVPIFVEGTRKDGRDEKNGGVIEFGWQRRLEASAVAKALADKLARRAAVSAR